MAKRIVARFSKSFEKIRFYEVMADYKHYTIIREQGTDIYLVWNNKKSLVSEAMEIVNFHEDKDIYKEIINDVKFWFTGAIFFWADSKFVTEYGLPYYDKLVNVYKELIRLKRSEIEIHNTLNTVKKEKGLIGYLRCKIISFRFLLQQRRTVKKLEKEFKLIW